MSDEASATVLLRVSTGTHTLGVELIKDPDLSDEQHAEALRRALRLAEHDVRPEDARGDRAVVFTGPDMVWLPLNRAQLAALNAGGLLRIDIEADPVEGTGPVVVMVRPPKEQW